MNPLLKQTPKNKNSEVENLLQNKEQEINQTVQQEAMDYARVNRPAETENNLNLYINSITTAWQTVLEKVYLILGLENSKSIGSSLRVSLNIEKEDLESQLPSLYEQERTEQMKMRSYDSTLESVFRDWKYAQIAIVFMLFGELAINFRAFDLLTQNPLLSLVSALGVGVVLFSISLLQHYIFTRVQNKLKRNIYTILLSALVLSMLWGLSQMRVTYLTMMNESIAEHMNPWWYVAISFLFYLGGLTLSFLFFPTAEQRKTREQYITAKSNLDAIYYEIEKIKARIIEIPKELQEKLTYHYSVLVMGHQYEKQIESLHQSSLALFIKTNLSYRSTPTPKMFHEPMPELSKQFTNILKH